MSNDAVAEFRRSGYRVLSGLFVPGPLNDEVDRALAEGSGPDHPTLTFHAGEGMVTLKYLPLMSERTPLSLELADVLAGVAAELLERPVLPGRSKGTRYYGDTSWHRDSTHPVESVGCVAYLDVVTATTGALRVVAGSHTDTYTASPEGADPVSAQIIATTPGDVILFDEHLIHGSIGGSCRTQWRVDFVVDPRDHVETAAVRRWYDQSLPNEHEVVGYDASRYPSYGPYWRSRNPCWTERLEAIGVLGDT